MRSENNVRVKNLAVLRHDMNFGKGFCRRNRSAKVTARGIPHCIKRIKKICDFYVFLFKKKFWAALNF